MFFYDNEQDVLYINCDANTWAYNKANLYSLNIELFHEDGVPKCRLFAFTKHWPNFRVQILHSLRALYGQQLCDALVEYLEPPKEKISETSTLEKDLQAVSDAIAAGFSKLSNYFEAKIDSLFNLEERKASDTVWIDGKLYRNGNLETNEATVEHLKNCIRTIAGCVSKNHEISSKTILSFIGE